MRNRSGRVAAIVAALVAVYLTACQQAPSRPRVILLSIDAGADWMFDELLARGRAPAFARLAETGAHADALVTVLPTLTAPSHASLWTGAYPRVHGISGNNVPRLPRAQHLITDSQSGFDSDGLVAEPIWIAAARQGRRVFVAQATGAAPFTSALPDRLLMFDTYARSLLPIALIEGEVGTDRPFTQKIGDNDVTLTRGSGGGLDVSLGSFHGTLQPGPSGSFSPPIGVSVNGRQSLTRIRLIRYSPESGSFALLRGRVDELQSNHPERVADLRAAAGTIVGENITRFYARGRFGPTRAEGGDGTAEELVAQTVEANHEYFTGIVTLAAREEWDLLVLYVSTLDITGHALVGMIDPNNPAYRPDVAGTIWPVIERVASKTIDPLVASLRTRFADATLLVVADHGMEGASAYVNTNIVLRNAGLLSLTDDGTIDLARTKALQPASMAGGVFINTTEWKGGSVSPAERLTVKRAVTAAMLGVRDPATGSAPIRAVFDADTDGEALGFGGQAGPDLFFDTAAGYITSARLTGDLEIEPMEPPGNGEHGNAPWHRNLQAIFFAAGPQVSAHGNPGLVRSIDVAPTVARLLGIDPPKQATGRVIPLGPTTR